MKWPWDLWCERRCQKKHQHWWDTTWRKAVERIDLTENLLAAERAKRMAAEDHSAYVRSRLEHIVTQSRGRDFGLRAVQEIERLLLSTYDPNLVKSLRLNVSRLYALLAEIRDEGCECYGGEGETTCRTEFPKDREEWCAPCRAKDLDSDLDIARARILSLEEDLQQIRNNGCCHWNVLMNLVDLDARTNDATHEVIRITVPKGWAGEVRHTRSVERQRFEEMLIRDEEDDL